MSRHETIQDYTRDVLHFKPYDLYHWKCAVPGCKNGTKVRKYDITDPEIMDASHYVRAIIAYNLSHPGDPLHLYAQIRSSRAKWITQRWFYMCGRHWKANKARRFHMPDELIAERGTFTLLKANQTDQNAKYSIIQKIRE